MEKPKKTAATLATEVPLRVSPSVYPAPYGERVEGRTKRQLGNFFGLRNFGVNLTELAPGSQSALLHSHSKQDEFIYVLVGEAMLETDAGKQVLTPGMCVGFPAMSAPHHLINESDTPVIFLEIGDRTANDEVAYPNDDLKAVMENGKWVFQHKDGSPY